MKKHFLYFKYLVRHKWFVLVAGLKIGAPLWRLLVHDLSKFLPSEWGPYVEYFYGEDVEKNWLTIDAFNHWQYWILREDSGLTFPLWIEERYWKEMVADWAGAGRAITGKWDVCDWYLKNEHKILIEYGTKSNIYSCICQNFNNGNPLK